MDGTRALQMTIIRNFLPILPFALAGVASTNPVPKAILLAAIFASLELSLLIRNIVILLAG